MNKKQTNPLLEHEDKWVALDPDSRKVVAHASSVKSLDNKLNRLNDKESVMTKVMPFDGSYSP